jgi:pimeloyl-ACP methyl ester carboxylesterase
MDDTDWNHEFAEVNDIEVHYVRHGDGPPLFLLHGWPEFWYAYRKNIPVLAEDFEVVVPDLRGFGDTENPDLSAEEGYAVADHVADVRGLADELGFDEIGIVTHDAGSYVAQEFARTHPDRLAGLFFFNCLYPGIGRRTGSGEHVEEVWYQTFNSLPWAADLVGSSRETCRLYLDHFLSHWASDPDTFDDDLDAWVDSYMQSNNIQAGFYWYNVTGDDRIELMKNGAPELPKIETPTRVMWGQDDPIHRVEFSDRLEEYFADVHFSSVPDTGHYVHYERPELTNEKVAEFFSDRF